MTPMTRTLLGLFGGVCLGLIFAAAAGSNRASAADSSPSAAPVPPAAIPALPAAAPPPPAAPDAPDPSGAANLDSLVSAILDRPLFNADRHAPAPPVEEKQAAAPPEVKTPPVLKGRLAGVTLGPNDEKRAVFARMGEKTKVVHEGDDVDGWTVSSIEASRVVLTSAFGEQVVRPTPSVAGEGITPEMMFPKGKMPGVPPQMPVPRPNAPGAANFGGPNFPNPQLARPPTPPGRPLAAARRNQ